MNRPAKNIPTKTVQIVEPRTTLTLPSCELRCTARRSRIVGAPASRRPPQAETTPHRRTYQTGPEHEITRAFTGS